QTLITWLPQLYRRLSLMNSWVNKVQTRNSIYCADGYRYTMPSTHKKVIVRKLDRDSAQGYITPADFVSEGKLELLSTAVKLVLIELRDIKGIYFVREFGDSDAI